MSKPIVISVLQALHNAELACHRKDWQACTDALEIAYEYNLPQNEDAKSAEDAMAKALISAQALARPKQTPEGLQIRIENAIKAAKKLAP